MTSLLPCAGASGTRFARVKTSSYRMRMWCNSRAIHPPTSRPLLCAPFSRYEKILSSPKPTLMKAPSTIAMLILRERPR